MKALILTLTLFLNIYAHGFETYSEKAFEEAQNANKNIILHFHADWCPTCKSQDLAFAELDKKGVLKNVTLMKVDFDKEKTLEKSMKVHTQATLIAFIGKKEVGRSIFKPAEEDIQEFIQTSFSKK